MAPRSARQPPRPNTADLTQRGQRSQRRGEPGVQPGCAHALGEQPSAPDPPAGTARASWPKPLTTRTPVTVSSTCCGDVGRALLSRPGRREQRRAGVRMVTSPAAGSTTSATSVSSGDSHSIAPTRRRAAPARAERQRDHRQQPLHQLQVGDRPRDDLAGAQRVLLARRRAAARRRTRRCAGRAARRARAAHRGSGARRRCRTAERRPDERGDQGAQRAVVARPRRRPPPNRVSSGVMASSRPRYRRRAAPLRRPSGGASRPSRAGGSSRPGSRDLLGHDCQVRRCPGSGSGRGTPMPASGSNLTDRGLPPGLCTSALTRTVCSATAASSWTRTTSTWRGRQKGWNSSRPFGGSERSRR